MAKTQVQQSAKNGVNKKVAVVAASAGKKVSKPRPPLVIKNGRHFLATVARVAKAEKSVVAAQKRVTEAEKRVATIKEAIAVYKSTAKDEATATIEQMRAAVAQFDAAQATKQ